MGNIWPDFLCWACENGVDVIPFPIGFTPSATIRDLDGSTAVFFDFSQIRTRKKLNTVALHERGHIESGALHGVLSPYEVVARMEYKANRYATQLGIPFENLRDAVRAGMSVDELADYFDVTEDAVRWAITYYTERRGMQF